jgi:hypothetical protein
MTGVLPANQLLVTTAAARRLPFCCCRNNSVGVNRGTAFDP